MQTGGMGMNLARSGLFAMTRSLLPWPMTIVMTCTAIDREQPMQQIVALGDGELIGRMG